MLTCHPHLWHLCKSLDKWHLHRETMGLEGGVSSLVSKGRNAWGLVTVKFLGMMKFSVSNFRFLPQIFGGGFCSPWAKPPCQMAAQASAQAAEGIVVTDQCRHLLICFVPLMGSCSQIYLILHPHRVAVPFPPTFASPWRNSFVQIHRETLKLCSRQNLGPPLKNNQKWPKFETG